MDKNIQPGDTVIILNEDTQKRVIGKIEEIFNQGKEKVIRYNEFYFPEKTSVGRLSHNSKFELYKTDEIEKEFYSNIVDKCEVVKFDQYIKRILTNKERRSDILMDKVYFIRQKYNPQDDNFTPDLSTSCYCDQIFNPDEIFIQCRECKELIHVNCFLSGETKKCFNSSCNNSIETQLSQSSHREQTVPHEILKEKLVGTKRMREEIPDSPAEFKFAESTNIIAAGSINLNSPHVSYVINLNINDSNLKKTNEDKLRPHNSLEDKFSSCYANLSENRRRYLINLIENLEKKNSVNKPPTSDEKSRKNIRDKISYQLLYGLEEIKEYNDFYKMKNPELFNPNILDSSAIRICYNIAIAIESAIYLQNMETINQNYKKKFQVLFPNLSDARNYELRFAILNNDISPAELIKMSSEELAPTSLKKRRIERQEKYFKEQVLMKEEAKIISKTHKGEHILTVNKEANDEEDYFEPENIPDNKSKKENKKTAFDNKWDDHSKKASWNYNSDDVEKKEINVIKKVVFNSKESENKKNPILKFSNGKSKSDLSHNNNSEKNIDITFKNLSTDMMNFYYLLQEYKKENLVLKFNDKLKSCLKAETYQEIIKYREAEKSNSNQ